MGYLGVDIGGTKVAFRLVRSAGTACDSVLHWPPAGDPSVDFALLAAHVATLRVEADVSIGAVGVAVPATVDKAGIVVTWPNRPTWTGLDLVGALRDLFPGTRLDYGDDGDLAALAEAHAADCADLVYVGVGTGVGGGIVSGGRVWPGRERGSCELGHVIVAQGGPRCDCGRLGCVQAFASGPATLRRAARLGGAGVDPAEFSRAVLDGRKWAVSALVTTAEALATMVTGVNELCHPDLVLIGGGFAAAVPSLVREVGTVVAALSRSGSPVPPVRPAVLGATSSLAGAVLLARRGRAGSVGDVLK